MGSAGTLRRMKPCPGYFRSPIYQGPSTTYFQADVLTIQDCLILIQGTERAFVTPGSIKAVQQGAEVNRLSQMLKTTKGHSM